MLKSTLYKPICTVIFVLAAFSVYAQQKNGSKDARSSAMEPYRSEIAAASRSEISAESAGVWYDILDSALFMLIRKTELYRGSMRLLIEENSAVKCRIYPDGTILVSTGIFDYIDAKLANSQNVSPRKIKNFNTERENLLAPFLAYEAAHFSFEGGRPSLSETDLKKDTAKELIKRHNLKADAFAVILLKLAGYQPHLFYDYLNELKKIEKDSVNYKNFVSFFKENYPPQKRLEALLKTADETDATASEVSYILTAMQSEDKNADEDARQRCSGLKNNFPDNIYFKRLAALLFHKSWLTGLQHNEKKLLTALPYAAHITDEIAGAFKILETAPETFKTGQTVLREQKNKIPGSAAAYNGALKAYGEYLEAVYEPAAASAYASLLFYSDNPDEKARAIPLAETAAANGLSFDNYAASINYAALLYLSGRDYTKAKLLSESVLNAKKNKTANSLFLRTGSMIDERLVLYNYAAMLSGLGETNKAATIKEKLKTLITFDGKAEPFPLKKVKIGDSADELIEYWGKPPVIEYNYFLETWIYGHLNAEVLIRTRSDNLIEKIKILQDSVLSLPEDLRIGENRRAFESVFGSPVYYAADSEIYFYKGVRIQILYLNNHSRQIILSALQTTL